MQREILFRGKRKDTGEWVEGYLYPAIGVDKGKWLITVVDSTLSTSNTYAVLPETVGQYTGLTDENDMRVFEGDIVKVTDLDGNIRGCDCGFGNINMCNGLWYIDGEVNNGLWDCINILEKEIEVIGNIHDYPDMMTIIHFIGHMSNQDFTNAFGYQNHKSNIYNLLPDITVLAKKYVDENSLSWKEAINKSIYEIVDAVRW